MKKIKKVTGIAIIILLLYGNLSTVPSIAQNPLQALVGSTDRVSISSDGRQENNHSQYHYNQGISADGRYVAFSSSGSNLVPDDTNNALDVFMHDRETGMTTRVSVADDGSQGNADSSGPAISADGRYVAFASNSTNLVSGDTYLCAWKGVLYYCWEVYVSDRKTSETTIVSVSSDGTYGNGDSGVSSISADGRMVIFDSNAPNLVIGKTNYCDTHIGFEVPCYDVFVHDQLTSETIRVSVASDGTQGDNNSSGGSISADGRYVVYSSAASNLITEDTNLCDYPYGYDNCFDVFIHDMETGETSRVSIASDGTQGNNNSSGGLISADGRFVVFSSEASNLVTGDTNNAGDIFVHDMETGETSRVSIASNGTQGDNISYDGSISVDGRFVVFSSEASNLVTGDTNNAGDIFLHDTETGETSRVSIASDGTQGDNNSSGGLISADGRYAAFESDATNLVLGDTNGFRDVFVRDRESVANLYSVSGYVSDSDGNPLPDVIISGSDGYSTVTDNQGGYTLSNLPSGTFWITPTLVGYSFLPRYHETSVPPERVEVNFIQEFYILLPVIYR